MSEPAPLASDVEDAADAAASGFAASDDRGVAPAALAPPAAAAPVDPARPAVDSTPNCGDVLATDGGADGVLRLWTVDGAADPGGVAPSATKPGPS
jgi:hypothetical protein